MAEEPAYAFDDDEPDDLVGTPAEDIPADEPAPESAPPPAEEPLAKSDSETWQAAFTKARQKDRQRYGAIEQEHGQYKDVLQKFYTDDTYAMGVLRQRFPHLGAGTPSPGTPQKSAAGLSGLMQEKLGTDLAFLAEPLADAVQSAVESALAPMQRQTEEQQASTRREKQLALMAEMDTKYPGWETQYGEDMTSLSRFLGSPDGTHPKYGSKLELLYKLLNPDQARVDLHQTQQRAARSRQSVSRTGAQTQPNLRERLTKAATNHDAFMLAARAAAEELGL